jgi:hypothetical protein
MLQFSNPSEEFKRKNPHIFGGAGAIQGGSTPSASCRSELNTERELQGQIVNLLRLKGVEVLWHRTDKKSAATVGWPDLTFAVESGLRTVAIGMEVKLPGKKLSTEQQKVAVEMMNPPNSWTYHVVTSVDEVLSILRKLGIE